MAWNVTLTGKANKQAEKLPMAVRAVLQTLMDEIAINGPVRGD